MIFQKLPAGSCKNIKKLLKRQQRTMPASSKPIPIVICSAQPSNQAITECNDEIDSLGYGGDRLVEALQVENYQEQRMRFPANSPESEQMKKLKKLISPKEQMEHE